MKVQSRDKLQKLTSERLHKHLSFYLLPFPIFLNGTFESKQQEHMLTFFKVKLSLGFPVSLSNVCLTYPKILAVSKLEQPLMLKQVFVDS